MKSRGSNSFHGIGYAWLLVTIFCLSSTTSHTFNYSSNNSTYVERCRADCASHKDLISCGKFRVVRWLNDIAREKVGFVQVFFFCFNFIVEYSNSEYISKFLSPIQNIKRESLNNCETSCTSSEQKSLLFENKPQKNEAIFSTRYIWQQFDWSMHYSLQEKLSVVRVSTHDPLCHFFETFTF